jgi:hypothetical protein
MTPDQVEDVIERTSQRTAEKIRDEVRGMFTALGFNMDPDKAHEEQQMVAFSRRMYQGTGLLVKAVVGAAGTAAMGWIVYAFTWRPHP